MKKILFIFIVFSISQTLSAQNNLMLLSESFKEIELPYYSSKDYFPLVGFDESLEVEYEIGPLENGLVKEVTSILQDKYPEFKSTSRYYSIGKFSHKNVIGIIFYQVITDPQTGYIYGAYNLAVYTKENQFLGEKMLGKSPESEMIGENLMLEFIQFSEISIVDDNLVINNTLVAEISEEDAEGNWNLISNEATKTKIVFNQDGKETETSM